MPLSPFFKPLEILAVVCINYLVYIPITDVAPLQSKRGQAGSDDGDLYCHRGGVIRETNEQFMVICPGNNRTKAVLWPLIQANVKAGVTLFSDGWKAYRKLPTIGYPHRWVDHSKEYVDPSDRTLHTNKIEGAWPKVKNFLPSSGA